MSRRWWRATWRTPPPSPRPSAAATRCSTRPPRCTETVASCAGNVDGARNVLGLAHELGLDPILHVSSIVALFPLRGPAISVDDPVGSLTTTYGRSKAEGEHFARALQATGAPVVTIYPSGVYGPYDPGLGETIKGLRDCVRWVWPWTSSAISIVDVRDVARIIVAALEPGRGPRRYMAGGHLISFVEQAQLCERLTGTKLRRMPSPPFLLRGLGFLLDLVRKLVPFEYPLTYEAALMIDQNVPFDSRATVEELGVAFRPIEETFADTLRWLYEAGHIGAEVRRPARRGFREPRSRPINRRRRCAGARVLGWVCAGRGREAATKRSWRFSCGRGVPSCVPGSR